MKPLVVRSAVVAALGGLLFGFDTAVISGTTQDLVRVYDLTGGELGLTVATALIGTVVGALTAGQPADRYGRKKVLFVIGVLYFVSALGSGLVSDWYWFMFFRFIGGLGVGAASVTAPIYTAEVSPPRVRGRLVGLVQFNIVLGILLAYLSNFILSQLVDEAVAWRWMFAVEAVPAAVFFLLLFTIPESPRWLITVGRDEQARRVVDRLATSPEEGRVLVREVHESLERDRAAVAQKFFVPAHRRVILMAFAIAAFNQLSGINAILYYAPDIFRLAGAGDDSAFLQSIAVGVVNLVMTMVGLALIDRFGRRRLMLLGSIGYLVSLGVVAWLFLTQQEEFTDAAGWVLLTALLVFIAAHAIGQGTVIWVFISEIFPNRVRGRGQALGSFTHWIFAAVISLTFPAVVALFGGGVMFLVFFVCMVLQLWWVLRIMPETKGVPLEHMEERLGLVRA